MATQSRNVWATYRSSTVTQCRVCWQYCVPWVVSRLHSPILTLRLSHRYILLNLLEVFRLLIRGYRGGSPTAIQAWWPCPLWEPSPSHPIVLVYTRGLCCCVFCMCVVVLCCCILCCLLFLGFSYFCSVFLQYFDTVGWVFWPVKLSPR